MGAEEGVGQEIKVITIILGVIGGALYVVAAIESSYEIVAAAMIFWIPACIGFAIIKGNYKRNIARSRKVAERVENLSEFHSEGLINESDYERKKQEILDEA
jgi:multisubunit Na+/H+ antiporter MnhG subunit